MVWVLWVRKWLQLSCVVVFSGNFELLVQVFMLLGFILLYFLEVVSFSWDFMIVCMLVEWVFSQCLFVQLFSGWFMLVVLNCEKLGCQFLELFVEKQYIICLFWDLSWFNVEVGVLKRLMLYILVEQFVLMVLDSCYCQVFEIVGDQWDEVFLWLLLLYLFMSSVVVVSVSVKIKWFGEIVEWGIWGFCDE